MFWLVVSCIFFAIEAFWRKGYCFWLAVIAAFCWAVLFALPWWAVVLVFIVFSPIALWLWHIYIHRSPKVYEQIAYVRDAENYKDREFMLTEPVVEHKSQIEFDDSIWPIYCRIESLPAGTQVRVSRVNGVVLIVERLKRV